MAAVVAVGHLVKQVERQVLAAVELVIISS
jgi:hypothetical protein